MQEMQTLPVDEIRTDGGTQSRAETDAEVVEEYATLMADGVVFPPVVVFRDGADHWLADGFHRLAAARRAGVERVAADVRAGGRREATLFGIEANGRNPLKWTRADKQRVVHLFLADAEWSAWSDREIARMAGVAHSMVSRIRRESYPGVPARKGADGRTIHVSNIGGARSGPDGPSTPADAETLREIESKIEDAAKDFRTMGLNLQRLRDTLGPEQFEAWVVQRYPNVNYRRTMISSIEAAQLNPDDINSILAIMADSDPTVG